MADGEMRRLGRAAVCQVLLFRSALGACGLLAHVALTTLGLPIRADACWMRRGPVIPDAIAKNATGKVVRIPMPLMEELSATRVPDCPFVFAGFTDELRALHLADPRKAHHAAKIKELFEAEGRKTTLPTSRSDFRQFCVALREFPDTAKRLGLDLGEQPAENELLAEIRQLPTDRQAKLVQDMMASILGADRSAG